MKQLVIGGNNFKEFIERDYYYVDKTLLIKEIEEIGDKVILFCRPRRFGKTLNLSMLKYFYEKTPVTHEQLFHNLSIWKDQKIRHLQGQFPVIFISFKDVKAASFEKAYNDIILMIVEEFNRHAHILLPILSEHEQNNYKAILAGAANESTYGKSLKFLTKLLHQYYGKNTIVLLDEYDTPIHAAYHYGYYQEMVNFIRDLFSAVLKDNDYLERGVLTGILRTAKEGIFSGLNNLDVCTVMNNSFSDKFGFTEHEVDQFLHDQNIGRHAAQIKAWYNGYHAGDNTLLYNPWSILKCAKNDAKLMLYWLSTSDNKLIKQLLIRANQDAKKEFEDILQNIKTPKVIDEGFTFNNIENHPSALWSLLLFSGYLTYSDRSVTDKGKYSCDLSIPNNEIRSLFEDLIKEAFEQSLTTPSHITLLLNAITAGDVVLVGKLLQEFIATSMSVFDLPHSEPERSYHLFILGLLVMLGDNYHVRSNRESGYGRYDIMLVPKNKQKTGVIIEFKKVDLDVKETLEQAAVRALEQINAKNYAQELRAQAINEIVAYGIACQGKQIMVKMHIL